jgi:DNA repair protein RecO (recombination protein O)
MLFKTGGIALSFIKYKESSIISKVFTKEFGIQSYIVNSIRSKSSKTKIALFQPLTILDLVVYHNKKKEINRISEIKCGFSFQSIPFNIKKTSIALFLTELLTQTLKEETKSDELFEFVWESILTFDQMEGAYENFHLQFMMLLSRYLGILPESANGMLKEVGHIKSYDKLFTEKVDFFIQSNYNSYQKITKTDRNEILMLIIDYFRFHYDSIREFKSIHVLKEVLG